MNVTELRSTRRTPSRAFRSWRWFGLFFGGVIVLATVLWLSAPSPVAPAAWTPQPSPELTGVLAVNTRLSAAERFAEGELAAPEDIAFDRQGRLYSGSSDGRIYRLTPTATGWTRASVFAATGGRPLGLAFDRLGNLIVADAERGLLEVDPQGRVRLLTATVDNTPISYADELAIAQDGIIYFSDASSRFDSGFPYDMLEARPYGRLLAYDPRSGATTVLLNGLYFANGVALAPDESFVLVVESFRYRISRYWLSGPRAGTSDIFADNLPGFGDNLTATPSGSYWLAMNNVRPAFIDFMHPRPFLKTQFAKLGQARIREIASDNRYGLVVQLGAGGNITRSLHDPTGTLASLSTAVPQQGYLYFGSLFDAALGRLKLEPSAAPTG